MGAAPPSPELSHEPALAHVRVLESALAELGRTGALCTGARDAALIAAEAFDRREPTLPSHGRPYARQTLLASAAGEIMLATWSPHIRCAPHDHGGSVGVVLVVAGSFEERSYAFDEVSLIERERAARPRGSAIAVSRTSIHDMECLSESGITLHLYAPAPEPMRIYDALRRETTVVGEGQGAWLPTEHALARTSWRSRAAP